MEILFYNRYMLFYFKNKYIVLGILMVRQETTKEDLTFTLLKIYLNDLIKRKEKLF